MQAFVYLLQSEYWTPTELIKSLLAERKPKSLSCEGVQWRTRLASASCSHFIDNCLSRYLNHVETHKNWKDDK